jgi:hypothetical protein
MSQNDCMVKERVAMFKELAMDRMSADQMHSEYIESNWSIALMMQED